MENILKQTATNSNFMDHLYCHPNEITKNYARNNQSTTATTTTTTNSSSNKSIVTNNIVEDNAESMLQEEVNSLKSMLLFHFDLIQTQAEQLQAKENELKAQRAECEKLRVRNTQLIGQVADVQQQLEEQLKRNIVIKRTSLPPPPLAKIQCLNENSNLNNNKGFLTTTTNNSVATSIPTIANTTLADKTRMPKLATVAVNVNVKNATIIKNMPTMTPAPLTVKEDKLQTINAKLKTATTTTINIVRNNEEEHEKVSRENDNSVEAGEAEADIEEKNNCLTKLHKTIENDIKEEIPIKRSSSILSIKATTTASSETTNCLSSIRSSTSCSSPASSTTLKGKRRRVWQVPELASDDSANSFDSMLDIETVSLN